MKKVSYVTIQFLTIKKWDIEEQKQGHTWKGEWAYWLPFDTIWEWSYIISSTCWRKGGRKKLLVMFLISSSREQIENRRIRKNEPFTDTTADESQNNNTEGKKPEKKPEYRMHDSINIKF